MNKTELVDVVVETMDISKAQAAKTVDVVLDVITNTLKEKGQVALVGFGTFGVRERAERTGRNPKTGEPVTISAASVPYFKPGKGLKDAVNDLAEA